jgi:hypothetical protein
MYKNIILILISLLIFGCAKSNKENTKPALNETSLNEIVLNAINGKKIYNDSLSGLIDYSLPLNSEYNDIKIDKVVSPFNKVFFVLLLEYPNPVYNRFAIYDSALHLMLMDKSLNGNIRMKTFNADKKQFIEVDESYLSKDVLEINRLSLYVIDSTASLGFRDFSKLATPANEYFQIITEISNGRINTNITSTKKSLINDKSDTFIYDSAQKKYLSPVQTFNNYVKGQVTGFKSKSEKPEISDEKSLLQSLGIVKDADTIKTASNLNSNSGYYLTIDEGWKEIKNLSLSGLAIRLKGNKYYNPTMGTNIFVAELPDGNPAEVFVKTGLRNIIQGKYRVRYSDKLVQRKFYVQYFEFSCGEKKYLMIFEASKFTYEKYKDIYQDIINSFVIDC